MTEPGTFEKLAHFLGAALAPLAAELEGEGALGVLAELGLNLPPELATPQLTSAFGTALSGAQQLPEQVAALADAVEADAPPLALVAAAAPLLQSCAAVIGAFDTIAGEVANLNLAELPAAVIDPLVDELPKRFLDRTLVRYLTDNQRLLTGLLRAVGVVRDVTVNEGSEDPFLTETTITELDLGRIGELFESPETVVSSLFGWGTPAFDGNAAIDLLHELLSFVGLPVAFGEVEGPPTRRFLEFFLAALIPTDPNDPTIPAPGLELLVKFGRTQALDLAVPVADGFLLTLRASGAMEASTGVRLLPPAQVSVVPPQGTVQGSLGAGVARVPRAGTDRVELLGVAGGTSLSVQKLSFDLSSAFGWDVASGQATGEFGVEGRLHGGRLVVSLAEADGFVSTVMGGFGIDAGFDIGFGWRAGSGVYFTGSGGLVVTVPTHVSIGPVDISAIDLEVGVEPGGFPVRVGVTIAAALGPVAVVVEGIGAKLTVGLPDGGRGNLGPVDLSVAFQPPKGVGLSIDVGVLRGGGYLLIDSERGEYAGALELVLVDIVAVRAIGLITTRNPDGSPGFSLLLVITAEFPGGLQLGYGFTLLGVGGIVGLGRGMNLGALTEGVRTGAIESVMFPQDVVANAPRILSDLRAFFPVKRDTFLIGPMVKLGWGTPTLISVSAGVIIELPGNVAIVGVLKVALPTEDAALIKLQANFVGAIEFDAKRLWFFAALFDSRLLFLSLEGEMGVLVSWGAQPVFLVSVGGFHPRFVAPALPFPSPRRLAVSVLDTDAARITVSGYLAVTSNSVQFGATAELFFGYSDFRIEGHIAFDALVDFPPIHFVVEVTARVSLKVFGLGLFSIKLEFTLEGTSPWRAKGRGTLSLLFFDVSADFDETWGEPDATALDPVSVLDLVVAELAKVSSWTAVLPAGGSTARGVGVTLRAPTADEADEVVLHPVGSLRVSQRAVPLDLQIARVGARRAADVAQVGLAVTGATFAKRADVDEQFAVAQYVDMDDAAKVSRPSFEPNHGGVEIAGAAPAAATARATRRNVRYEEVVIDEKFRRRRRRFVGFESSLFDHFVAGAAVARSPLSQANQARLDPFADAIATGDRSYVVASTVDNSVHPGTALFTSEVAATQFLAQLVAEDPTLADQAQVLPAYDAVGVRS